MLSRSDDWRHTLFFPFASSSVRIPRRILFMMLLYCGRWSDWVSGTSSTLSLLFELCSTVTVLDERRDHQWVKKEDDAYVSSSSDSFPKSLRTTRCVQYVGSSSIQSNRCLTQKVSRVVVLLLIAASSSSFRRTNFRRSSGDIFSSYKVK